MQNLVERAFSLTDDDKWAAVTACGTSYDGLFFYGVRTTGVFCRPSCTSKTPLRQNVLFFDAAADAINSGFRPCKKCRPDMPRYEPERALVEKVRDACARSVDDSPRWDDLARRLGRSPNHLMRLFKRYEGCTRGQYLAKLRIDTVKRFLLETDMSILEIALCCGFESLSNFYRCFKEQIGVTPARYRGMEVRGK
jgi:AraC family transcriptional regulator, regulatory protein of adaptative response / methylphosphotriester-DNA alkyltransferase methyltransferase